jgi:hypothetical protein
MSLQFTNVGEVSERGLLGTDTVHLRGLHDKLALLARDHVRILLAHDVENTIEQLVVRVVALGALPVAAAVVVGEQLLVVLALGRVDCGILKLILILYLDKI